MLMQFALSTMREGGAVPKRRESQGKRIEAGEEFGYDCFVSIAEIKAEVDRLTPDERKQLANYLAIKNKMQDPEFVKELSRKIDDTDPTNWVTLEEAEKRLLPNE